jgi:peptidoglycan lytic transglycosylase
MFSSSCARTSYIDIEAICISVPLISGSGLRSVMQWLAVILGAASLAACTQAHVAANKSEMVSPGRQASQEYHREYNRTVSFAPKRRVAVARKHTPLASNRSTAGAQVASHGIASFYTEGTKTASGEKFNTHELTAAHPTLPFGTRLRVTNVASGQSVTVRVNDRGPYVRGRVVDVSYAAAESLGMVGGGVAKVKLDVVQ